MYCGPDPVYSDVYPVFSVFSKKRVWSAFDTDLFWTEHSICDAGRHGTFAGIIFHVFSGLRYRSLFFLNGVKQNETTLGGVDEKDAATSKIVVALNQLLGNREMYLVLAIMVVTLVIVYIIRKMSIEHAWAVAIIFGILFEAVGMIAGDMVLGISGKTITVLVGSIISCVIAFVIQFLFFNLDYSRTERLQFEDDEYYYYVKAVPKAIVAGTDKKVTRFSGKEEQDRMTKKRFAEEMEIDEDLLD